MGGKSWRGRRPTLRIPGHRRMHRTSKCRINSRAIRSRAVKRRSSRDGSRTRPGRSSRRTRSGNRRRARLRPTGASWTRRGTPPRCNRPPRPATPLRALWAILRRLRRGSGYSVFPTRPTEAIGRGPSSASRNFSSRPIPGLRGPGNSRSTGRWNWELGAVEEIIPPG
jgi:hypothetical protein